MSVINTAQPQRIRGRIITQPPQTIEDELVKITKDTIRQRQRTPIELIVDGIADGPSGFAVHLRDWVRHLVRYGVKVHIPHNRNSEYPEIAKLHDTEVEHPIKLFFLPGGGFPPKNPEEYTIGYTVFESDKFPEYFKDNAENVDLLWTASQFCYDRYVQVGIPKEKIEVFTEGVDAERFNPFVSPLLKRDKKSFTFGNVCGYSERKGMGVLLNAFLKEFDRKESVTLYISGGWYLQKKAEDDIRKVKKSIKKANFPEVVLDWADRNDSEMPAVFNSFDALSYPTKGEGYGRVLAEASACAIPVITTNAPPMSEIINESTGYMIDVEKIAPEPQADWICDWYKKADFYYPSEEHLRALMREVFTHPEEARAKATKAREFVKQHHNTSFVIEDVVKRLSEIAT